MKIVLDKKILKQYTDYLISRLKFLYGINYANELESRLNKINHLYISDEINSNTPMYYDSRTKDIYINASFVPKDSNGRNLIAFNNTTDFFKHSLIHELLHASSSREGVTGIMPIPNGGYKTAMNEGITQMLADEICGHYENKFLGSYNFEKIIANILRISFGNDVLLNSYFMDYNILDKKLKATNPINNFNTYLYLGLYHYNNNKDDNRKLRIDNILKLVVINVIVPTYQSLNEKDKQNYLSKIIYSISGDEVIKSKLIGYINEYVSKDKKQMKIDSNKVLDEFEEIYYSQDAISSLPDMNSFVVKDDGTVLLLGHPGKTIKSKKQLETIYNRLFELNGYKKYLTEKVINQYIDSIKKGKTLSINIDSILKRRIIFCGLKECILEKGYLLLNDFEELDKSKSIKVKYINKSVGFEDYKKMCENFSICKNVVGKKEYTYSIIYNSTKNEVEDETFRVFAFFAINYMNCVQDNGIDGINEAFSLKNLLKFKDVISSFYNVFENRSTFNVEDIAKVSKYPNLIRRMMKTPIQVEWVWNYINMMSKGPIKEIKSKSVVEINNPDYLSDRSYEEAVEIVRKNG